MEYREREWRREGKKYRFQQIWVPLSRISPYLIKAVLIGEDDKFWKHEGFDYEAIEKALEKDIKARSSSWGAVQSASSLRKTSIFHLLKIP